MNRIPFIAIVTILMTGCKVLSPEEKNLIAKADLIHDRPIDRPKLIASLGLDPNSSHRGGGGMRSGYMIFEESWTHSTGLTIKAYDTEYVGPIRVTSEMIDAHLNGTATIPGSKTRINSPRKSFNGFTISRDGSELYNSRIKQGEQAASSNH